MKKRQFIASLCFVSAGWAIELSPASVSAETPLVVQQQPAGDISVPFVRSQPTQIELLNPGSEPRQQMRLKPTLNVKEITLMTMKMGMEMSTRGEPLRGVKIPTSVITIETEATKIDDNGDIHYQFSYTNADIMSDTVDNPTALESMRSTIKKMVGLKGSLIMDSRGFNKGGNFILPPGSDNSFKQMVQQMSQSIDQLSAPLPTEAVGRGAKWRLSSSLNSNGINLNNIATYELMSFQDNVAIVNASLEQQAKPQTLNSPLFPAGSSVNLNSLASQGRGESTIRLDKLMPVRSAVSVNSNSEMSLKVPGLPDELTMISKFTMEMTLDSK
ncbi:MULTISPECIES: hypothetical protein [unclassified Microcoleus]|uniref:hypothetical protein n=1 Tax=unclassified Microcoleus TaxID=2642155 RepID=UPI002FCE9790